MKNATVRKKYSGESTEIGITKKMSEESEIEFFWTDDEMQKLLSLALQFKCKCEYEGRNWESIRSKYERIQEIIVESYPKTNKESKDFQT